MQSVICRSSSGVGVPKPLGKRTGAVSTKAIAAPPRPKVSYPPRDVVENLVTDAPDILYDAIVVGGGMGGLTTAAVMVSQGMNVLVLEK